MQNSAETSTKTIVGRLVLPASIGATLYLLRGAVTHTACAQVPTPCVPEAVNAIDRIVFNYGSVQADFWSNVLQNTVGALLFFGGLLLPRFGLSTRREAFHRSVLFLKITLWNFAVMESVRAVTQRPRPWLFRNPLEDGANYQLYNSFYSGHTSFMALATLSLAFYAEDLSGGKPSIRRVGIFVSIVLTLLTATLRVWGGRHYPTDTIAGAAAGWTLAWFFCRRRAHPANSIAT